MNVFRPLFFFIALIVITMVAAIITGCGSRPTTRNGPSTSIPKEYLEEYERSRAQPVAGLDRNGADLSVGRNILNKEQAIHTEMAADAQAAPRERFDGIIPENKPTAGAVISTQPPSPLLARDLGKGADNEKLGTASRRHDDDRPLPDDLVTLRENPFIRTADAGGDASTFAADVDSASYNVVRSCLTEQHRVPQPAEVRIEEMINRFAYQYPTPTAEDQHPFRINAEVVACPWRRDHQIVRIGIAGETLGRRQRPPANLVFLIDVSGSMSPENRLPLLKSSLSLLVNQLDERDRVAIVTYAGEAGIALDATAGDQHRAIRRVIDRLGAGGSTHGSAGIKEAYRMARLMQTRGSETRVILATDGDFNVGTTNHEELVNLVRREAEAGVYLTALGFGMGGGGDARLQQLADKGNGFHAFIDRADEAKRLFVTQLPSSLVTIAQDVKIQVFFNPAEVASWRLIGYEKRQLRREDFNNDRIDAGEIGAGHTMTALYEIVPASVHAEATDPNPFIANQRNERVAPTPFAGDTLLQVRLRYQPPGGGTSVLMEQTVHGRDWRRTPSADTSFAMGVAGFGMLLRGSHEAGSCSWDLVSDLVRVGSNDDEARQEVQELIQAARRIDR
jgi:Ca-activated chloride channel homolog